MDSMGRRVDDLLHVIQACATTDRPKHKATFPSFNLHLVVILVVYAR